MKDAAFVPDLSEKNKINYSEYGFKNMKTTHTPGPWTLVPDFFNAEMPWCAAKVVGAGHIEDGDNIDQAPIAYVQTTLDESNHANARLIAAAPELLDMARMAVAWAGKAPAPYRDWDFVVAARAAIAKATGQNLSQ